MFVFVIWGIIISLVIAKLKQTEQELRVSERKYRSIIENIEEGYYEVDLAGNYTFFNDSFCKIHGYSRDELIGMNYRQYMDPENANNIYRLFNKVYTYDVPIENIEYEIIKNDGTKIYIELSVSLIRNSNGEPTGFRGVVRDINNRKQNEEVLRESEEKFRKVFEDSMVGMALTHSDGRYLQINHAMTNILGYSQEEFLSMSIRDITVDDDLTKDNNMARSVWTGESDGFSFEKRYIHKDGHT